MFYLWIIKVISCLLLIMPGGQLLQCSRSFTWYVDWYWYDITMLRSRVSNDLVIMLLMGGYSLKCSLQQRSMDQTTTRISSLTLYIEISLRESTYLRSRKFRKSKRSGRQNLDNSTLSPAVHVITGDLNIVENKSLKDILSNRP